MTESALERGAAAPASARLRAWVRRHPLPAFFGLAFALTWVIMIPLTLSSWGLVPSPGGAPALVLLLLMAYGPTWAALLVTGALEGRAGVRALLSRLLIWRVGWPWYLVALFLNAILILAALGLYRALGGAVPPGPARGPGLVAGVLLTFVVVTLFNGEEIGWRGFALPRLEARGGASRWGVVPAVLLLGTLEALFHLPIFFNRGPSAAGGQSGASFFAFWAGSLGASLLLAWVYNNTRGSLLLAYLYHGSMNTWSSVLPFPLSSDLFAWCLAGAALVAAGAVVVAAGPTRLSRLPPAAMPFRIGPEPEAI
jgi:membrane protease YdiL (CAAX protease family)